MTRKFPLKSKKFNPFGALIGLEFAFYKKGRSRCLLKVRRQLLNPHGVVHGGVLFSMADTGMGAALYSLLDGEELCATREIKMTYLKPVTAGVLCCETRVILKGKKEAALESEVTREELPVARARGTFAIFKKRRGQEG